MVLLAASEGPLQAAIERKLRDTGASVTVAAPDDEDLWTHARNHTAVVYLPATRMLDAELEPQPSVDRMRHVLGAAEAPGVEVLVPVLPTHAAYDVEAQHLKKNGKPYAGVRVAPLLEEFSEVLADSSPRALWLPQIGAVSVCLTEHVAQAVLEAIDTELQGRIVPVRSERHDAATLVRRAAESAGVPLRVHRVWPWLFRVGRSLLRWFRRGESRLQALLDRLVPELGSAPPVRSLPAPGSK